MTGFELLMLILKEEPNHHDISRSLEKKTEMGELKPLLLKKIIQLK